MWFNEPFSAWSCTLCWHRGVPLGCRPVPAGSLNARTKLGKICNLSIATNYYFNTLQNYVA